MNQQQLELLLQECSQISIPLSLHIFDTLTSTNQQAWQLIDSGAPAGTVAIARQQTAGRGQWGRQWQSAPGGLYLSLVLDADLPAENSAQLTMASAWGIAQALRDRGAPVLLKWPNDLILLGRKLGGILTETRIGRGKIAKAVVGVGINWANPVPATGINLQSFIAANAANQEAIASLEMLAALTLEGLDAGYQCLKTLGIETLLPSYLELLSLRNRQVVVNGRAGEIAGVTPTGELRIRWQAAINPAEPESYLKPGTIGLNYDN